MARRPSSGAGVRAMQSLTAAALRALSDHADVALIRPRAIYGEKLAGRAMRADVALPSAPLATRAVDTPDGDITAALAGLAVEPFAALGASARVAREGAPRPTPDARRELQPRALAALADGRVFVHARLDLRADMAAPTREPLVEIGDEDVGRGPA